MFFEKEFTKGKFVLSKDEFCFKEVIEDFKNAKRIGIMTFNISKKDNDYLLSVIEKVVEEETEIQIITNIPSRFENYYNDRVKTNASTTIRTYLNKLNPQNFNEKMQAYFNFNNHVKIIATDNIAYWGSSNFSDESKFNYEAGTITKDKEFIKYLFEEYFKEIRKDSIPYYDDDYNELRLTIWRLHSQLVLHYNYFLEQFMRYHDEGDFYYYYGGNVEYSMKDFYNLCYIVEEFDRIEVLIENIDIEEYDIEVEVDNLLSKYKSFKIPNIRSLIRFNSSFNDYVRSDYKNIFDSKFESYSWEAYDEYLDYYLDKAADETNEKLNDIAESCKLEVINSIDEFETFINVLTDLIESIEDLANKTISKDIDNTL